MKKLLLLLVTTALLLGCTAAEDKAIATSAKVKITQAEFDAEVEKMKKLSVPPEYEMSEEEENNFKIQVMDNMLLRLAYQAEMDRLEIEADQEMIDAQFEQLIAQYGSEEALIADIESRGFTFDEVKEEYTYQFKLNELSKMAQEDETEVPEEQIVEFYEENKDTMFKMPEMVNAARHILIQITDNDEAAALEEINKIREEIIAGKDFAEAAVEYSQGPSAPNGGQLGQFQRGQMVGEFETVAFSLPVGEVSGPVLTQFGYHLILVEDRTDASYAEFEDTKEYITNRLKVDNFFKDIEKRAKIKKPSWAEI